MRSILQKIGMRGIVLAALIALCFGGAAVNGSMQEDDDTTRDFWDSGFLKQRPKSEQPTNPALKSKVYKYKRVSPKPLSKAETSDITKNSVVGITIWRLRASTQSDEKEVRLFTHKPKSKQMEELVPERVEADTPLTAGTRARFSIETPRAGYLYVIDREQYADGSYGDPYLIFPTTTIRGGDNQVMAGRVFEIPDQSADPPYYELERERADEVGEVLTVLVTPKPLTLKIGEDALKLTKEQVAEWEQQWGAKVERLELEGGAGKPWTKEEKASGASGKPTLTQDDPLPQTIYGVASKPGDPLLISVPVKIK
jgi:hypothetical protein